MFFCVVASLRQNFLGAIPFIIRPSGSGKFAEGGMNRTAKVGRSGCGTAVDGQFQAGECGGSN